MVKPLLLAFMAVSAALVFLVPTSSAHAQDALLPLGTVTFPAGVYHYMDAKGGLRLLEVDGGTTSLSPIHDMVAKGSLGLPEGRAADSETRVHYYIDAKGNGTRPVIACILEECDAVRSANPADFFGRTVIGCSETACIVEEKVSQPLREIISNPDLREGSQFGSLFAWHGEKVGVIINLESGSEGFILPDDLGIDVVRTADSDIYAFMPVSNIQRLTEYDEIDTIRGPPGMLRTQPAMPDNDPLAPPTVDGDIAPHTAGNPAMPDDDPRHAWSPLFLIPLIPAAVAFAVWQAKRGKNRIATA